MRKKKFKGLLMGYHNLHIEFDEPKTLEYAMRKLKHSFE